MPRLIVIGAGPMGLEAALGGLARGFEVTVLEQGRVGESLRRWGSTRLFSPFAMNLSTRAREVLGSSRPPDDELLSGPGMAEQVLEPLARALGDCVRTGHRVTAVGRARLTRRDLPGHPLRAERPFRLLVETPQGEELFEAECVLDASGVYDRPASLGAGGVPARGERRLQEDQRLIRHLGALEERREALAGRDLLLVGHGHSAANALGLLEALEPAPRITWATRSPNRRPGVEYADDPLPERERVTRHANDLAADPPRFLTVERRAAVEAVLPEDGRLAVTLSGGRGGLFDVVVGLTGYRPDVSFLSELALEVSPATEGAARLGRALSSVTDCLSVPAVAPRDLASGEPGFHLVGAKSYGRLPTFLLRTGLAQLETMLDHLTERP